MKKPLAYVALLLCMMVGALVLSSLLGKGGSEPVGPGSATAQAYVEHLRGGRRSEAETLWTAKRRESSAPQEASRTIGRFLEASDFVKFVESLTTDDRACHFGGIARSGTIFDQVSHSVRIYLVREDGAWRIDAVQAYGNGEAAPVPPWPEEWHPRSKRSSCGSGYR